MNRKVSFNGLVAALLGFTDEEQRALMEHVKEVKEFLAGLVRADEENTFFTAISDKDAPARLADAAAKWRKLASDLDYTGPVLWRVRGGFTLKEHAPLAGPYSDRRLNHYDDWKNFQDDQPTVDSLVFFIPRAIAAADKKRRLAEYREKYGLPERHLNSFGSAALVSGLILAHFKRTGERVPSYRHWVCTETYFWKGWSSAVLGGRLILGEFDRGGLCSDVDIGWGDNRRDILGVFPLGIEMDF